MHQLLFWDLTKTEGAHSYMCVCVGGAVQLRLRGPVGTFRSGVLDGVPSLGQLWPLDQDDNLNRFVTALAWSYNNATGLNTSLRASKGASVMSFRRVGVDIQHEVFWPCVCSQGEFLRAAAATAANVDRTLWSRQSGWWVTQFLSLNPHHKPYKANSIIVSTLHMRKLKHREEKKLAPSTLWSLYGTPGLGCSTIWAHATPELLETFM